ELREWSPRTQILPPTACGCHVRPFRVKSVRTRFRSAATIYRRNPMKMLFAVIQPTKLDAVQQALARLDVTRMTVCDAMGYARQRGQLETYRGHEYKTNLLRKIALEIAVNDDFLDRTVDCLVEVVRTSAEGHIGDGKIFVVPMEQAIQLSDG